MAANVRFQTVAGVNVQPTESPAQIYERYMVPAIFAAWVPSLLDFVALGPGERVLDLACGTGAVALAAARPRFQPGSLLSVGLVLSLKAPRRAVDGDA